MPGLKDKRERVSVGGIEIDKTTHSSYGWHGNLGRRLPVTAVEWIPRIWKTANHATPQEVESLERAWGVKLPEDYKRVAVIYQGMAPEPCVVDTKEGNIVMSELLTISESEEFRAYSMADTHKLIQPHVPVGIYPFASTAHGDFLCFDYRSSPSAPRVVFYFTEASGEEAIQPVADSFSHLLSKLHD